VSGTLARLDEFGAFVDSLRSNSSSAATSLIPNLLQRAKQVEELYQKIDDFQAYLNVMEKSVERMEQRAEQVELAYGGSKVKNFLTSIVGRGSKTRIGAPAFPPAGPFPRTDEYFS